MRKFGLIGYPLEHSFSPAYFKSKFSDEGITDIRYDLYPLKDISDLESLLRGEPELQGLNVTIPYKEQVIPYLDEMDALAARIGAVNTIDRTAHGWKGYNTDYYGFKKSIGPFLDWRHERALILGSGGASKAVVAVLEDIGIQTLIITRHPHAANHLAYADVGPELLKHFKLLVNTTPLGTHPQVLEKVDIPYDSLTPDHLLIDLVYNPPMTSFMNEGIQRGAKAVNGYNMLVLQAERSWELWNGKGI